MKTIVNDLDMFKVSIKPDGKMDITLLGGKQIAGQLTEREMEQLLFRIEQTTEILRFDTEPQDLINVHDNDVKTLEEQAIQIETQRQLITQMDIDRKKLEAELAEAKHSCEELGKRLLTVHNVQQTTEQVSSEQTSSVHNVQAEA